MEVVLVPKVKRSAKWTSPINILAIVLTFVATGRQKKPVTHPAANPANFAPKSSTEAALA